MHSNIETTIDRILADVVEYEFVTDLEPLSIRVIGPGTRPAATEPARGMRDDTTHEDCEDKNHSVDDEIS